MPGMPPVPPMSTGVSTQATTVSQMRPLFPAAASEQVSKHAVIYSLEIVSYIQTLTKCSHQKRASPLYQDLDFVS